MMSSSAAAHAAAAAAAAARRQGNIAIEFIQRVRQIDDINAVFEDFLGVVELQRPGT